MAGRCLFRISAPAKLYEKYICNNILLLKTEFYFDKQDLRFILNVSYELLGIYVRMCVYVYLKFIATVLI